jgi:DNA polymerase-3 subunit delta'
MHAFLIVSQSSDLIDKKIEGKIKEMKLKPLNSVINKIEEVRLLESYIKLKLAEPTGIIIKNIENASLDALNAFLKSLEEPQENLTFFLTCTSLGSIPDTIISRCQVIKIVQEESTKNDKFTSDFLKKSLSEKLIYIDSIKKKSDALDFINDIILGTHDLLLKEKDLVYFANILQNAEKLRSSLKGNGNISLQLTNFIIHIS